MKKLLLLAAAATLVLAGCKKDDNDPEPNPVVNNDQNKNKDNPNDNNGKQDPNNNSSSLPNYLKACINRDAHPIFKFSGALDVNEFHNNVNGIKDTVSKHFDEIVAGNAMKYGSVVNGSGQMDFSRVKQFCADAKSAGLSIFGHTLAWHSQQQPGYLLGLMDGKVSYSYLDQANNCLQYTIGDAGQNAWDHQAIYNLTNTMTKGKNYTVKVKLRASEDGDCALWPIDTKSSNKNQWGNSDDVQYLNGVGVTTHWKEYSWNFNANFPIDRLQFVFGKLGGKIYFDDLTVTDASSNSFADNGDFDDSDIASWGNTGCTSFEIFKEDKTEVATVSPLTDAEKRDTLKWAMDHWIKGMMDATDGYVKAWDVVNEALSGADGDGDGIFDLQNYKNNNISDPTNVSSGTFYWQVYMGDLEYMRTAVASARKHFKGKAEDLKLFVNDYNLESTWDDNGKLKSLIKWIEKWEADGVTKIDGIGTQMHITCYENTALQKDCEEHIVKMLQLMANTGKLVRISELDMGYKRGNDRWNGQNLGTAQLTAAEHQKMADYYKFIVTKYFEIVPPAQQYGICQWCLTDAAGNVGDKGGWRNGEPVGIWTQGFKQRKEAFKGFAEGLAEKK